MFCFVVVFFSVSSPLQISLKNLDTVFYSVLFSKLLKISQNYTRSIYAILKSPINEILLLL